MEDASYVSDEFDDFLAHHGVLGMKWGVRRYQNKDGRLTAAGAKRYNKLAGKQNRAAEKLMKYKRELNADKVKNGIRVDDAKTAKSAEQIAREKKEARKRENPGRKSLEELSEMSAEELAAEQARSAIIRQIQENYAKSYPLPPDKKKEAIDAMMQEIDYRKYYAQLHPKKESKWEKFKKGAKGVVDIVPKEIQQTMVKEFSNMVQAAMTGQPVPASNTVNNNQKKGEKK